VNRVKRPLTQEKGIEKGRFQGNGIADEEMTGESTLYSHAESGPTGDHPLTTEQ